MTLLDERLRLEGDEVQLSYFVKHKNNKPSRIGHAKLVDISEGGLCMEISPYDSDLFLESQGRLFIMSKELELQIFCRSHPMNVSVTGSIRWFKRKKEMGEVQDSENIYVGVMFPFSNIEQKQEITRLVKHLKEHMVKCSECNAVVSSEASICYSCGSKPNRKKNIFKKMIGGFLTSGDDLNSR
jgi:ribosomal protein L40E